MRIAPFFALLAIMFASHEAVADTLLSQPLNPTLSGSFSNIDPDDGVAQQRATSFDITVPTTLTSVSWQGRYGFNLTLTNPVAFTIRLFADDGGSPGVPVGTAFKEVAALTNVTTTGQTYTPVGANPINWLSYSTPLNEDLASGSYWLSIMENDSRSSASGASQWLWGHSSGGVPSSFRNSDAASWSISGENMAFVLEGTAVPEPGALMLLGATGLVALIRRKRSVR